MAGPERNMPDTPEIPTGVTGQPAQAGGSVASLSDSERLQSAKDLLKTQLTPKQEEAIIKAHYEASGEPGKNQNEAGINNYTQEQLHRKARILQEAGFSKEQRRALMESYITGVVPASEITINPADYTADARLNSIAQQIQTTATAGGTDENFFNRISSRIERLQDEGTVDSTLANNLLANVELWRLNAAARPQERRIKQRQVDSQYDNVLTNIRDLQAQPPSPDRNRLLSEAIDGRDNMRVEANTQGLFNNAKGDLFQIYYDSRVEVTRKQKLSVNETTRDGRPKLQELAEMQQDPDSWEARRGFWSDPALEARFGGVVDDFYKKSLDMIRAVVQNRKANLSEEGLNQLWNYKWQWDPDEAPIQMENFDAVRERVEKERKKRYWVSNRGDYESWIQLVADDLDEVEESIPFMLDYIRTKFQPNDPNKVFETVEQEKDKIVKALDKFGYERGYEIGSPEYRKVRRVKSRLGYEINLAGAEYFAKVLHESWDPYLKFMGTIGRSFQDTETQDHFVDAILLDNEGMTMLALDEFEKNDGEYWRYGDINNTSETQDNIQIGEAERWQANRRAEILKFLVNNELRPMDQLLQNHPAFQRLRAQLNQLDQADVAAGRALIDPNDPIDVNGNPKIKTRLREYVEKAMEWGRNRTIGDPRDKRQRVFFQHPLARGLTDDEFRQMYQPIQRLPGETDSQFQRRLREKKGRMQTIIDTALRIATAFQQDADAGLARHILTPAQKQELGLPLDDEAIAHGKLIRILFERAIKEDEDKSPKQQRFKLTHVLQKMGLPRNLPLFSNWYLGAHDSIRPGLIYNGIRKVPELMELLKEKRQVRALDPDDYLGGDHKTSITRWPEEERQFAEMMELYVREKYPTYFNYPGHDIASGGVKEMRNALLFPYGQSWGTVELSSLVKNMWLGENAFLRALGCLTWKQLVALAKGGNEIVFQRMGSLFESPRDVENWVKRIGVLNEESKLLTSGDERIGAILNDGWGSGFYQWRALNRAASFIALDRGKIKGTGIIADIYTTIRDPERAYPYLDQKTYEAYVKLAGQFAAPLIAFFKARLKLENVYGRNPGTAMILNTLTWYACSNWMDRNWEEYRGKFGNALDVNLHMARKFIRTVLYESRLIHYDDQWDQRILGYTIPRKIWERIKTTNWGDMTEEERKKFRPIKKAIRYQVDAQGRAIAEDDIKDYDESVLVKKGDPVDGETFEGILDAFPREWRDEIIKRNNQKEEPWIIPMGLNTEYPETLSIIARMRKYGDSEGMFNTYSESVLKNRDKQTRQRKTVKRN